MTLNPSEFEALLALCEGETTPETAARLGLHHNAVSQRRQKLFSVLGARTAAHAVALAYHEGILTPRVKERHAPDDT